MLKGVIIYKVRSYADGKANQVSYLIGLQTKLMLLLTVIVTTIREVVSYRGCSQYPLELNVIIIIIDVRR